MTTRPLSPNAWRRVVAALAHPDTRRVFALLETTGDASEFLDGLAPARRSRIVSVLSDAGLVDDHEGVLTLRASVFADLLAQNAPRRVTGIDRFLRDGRIAQYPASPRERGELLRWISTRVLTADEVVNERTITERLAVFSDDPAVLRRYLVDFGLVERQRDGSQYALVTT